MRYNASFFLRIGLAFVFIYAAVAAYLDPKSWVWYIPEFLGSLELRGKLLYLHEIANLTIGLWLISGKKTFYASIICCLALAAIILVNLTSFFVVFRDVGLLFSAVALAFLSKKEK